MAKKIGRSRLKCLVCNTVLESENRHDYKTCGCPNNAMLDGGCDYLRYGAADMSKIELLTKYVDEDAFMWGVFDYIKGRTVPKNIQTLEDSHVQNIALHLRNRYKDRDGGRHLRDLQTLNENVLPELKRRGLEEVTEEIPYERGPEVCY